MENSTNLGLSLGQLISGAFDGSAKQNGMMDRAKLDQLNANAEKARIEGLAKQQELDNSSDDGLAKALLAGIGANSEFALNDFKATMAGNYEPPQEQQGPSFTTEQKSRLNPAIPEYVTQFPELQKRFSGLKQMIAAGDKNLLNLSKSIGQDYENKFASGDSTQGIEDYANRQAAIKGNIENISQNRRIGQVENGGLTPEAKKALVEAITLGNKGNLYNFSANGTGDNVTGEYTTTPLGESAIDLNRAKVGQTNSATDLNRANTGLVGAKTVTERSKSGPATTAPNGQAYSTKPIPTPALKLQQEELEAIGTVSGTNADLAAIEKQIEDGKLHLGTFENYLSGAKNYLGASDETSQNYATLKATLEKARNASLILNKGVQTDGDAQRAWNELLTNLNDPKVVKKRLAEIQATNERAVKLRKAKVDNLRKNYNAPPLDYSEYEAADAAVKTGSDKKIKPANLPSVSNW